MEKSKGTCDENKINGIVYYFRKLYDLKSEFGPSFLKWD